MKPPPMPEHVLKVPGGELEPWGEPGSLVEVGKSRPKRTSHDKVTGRARYASDMSLPGMLHAAILRATIARGRVTAFDTSKAKQVKGVRYIMTADDLPDIPGKPPASAEIRYLPGGRTVLSRDVRFVGEEIAAVAADTIEAAREAMSLIQVTYEKFPAVIEAEDAIAEQAPRLAEEGNLVGGEPESYIRGDPAAAAARAAHVMERTYTTDTQYHQCLEPHGCVAAWDRDGLVMHDSNQGIHQVQDGLAAALGLPMNRIRILNENTGGGFGSKNGVKPYHVIAALLARATGRPVRLFMNRREEFIAAHQRPRTRQHYRAGLDAAGHLVFMEHDTLAQGGPDGNFGRFVARADLTQHLYACPDLKTVLRRARTNTQNVIACRGPTAAENLFALEQFIDELAHEIHKDPLEFRRLNHTDIDPVDRIPYSSKALLECYDAGAKAIGWKWEPPPEAPPATPRRGLGMSSLIFHGTPGEQSQVMVVLQGDGTVEVLAGISEFGVGAETILAQIAAEELGVPFDDVRVSYGDSRHHPYTINSSYGSRTTVLGGPAVRAAANAALRQILEKAAKKLERPVEELTMTAGVISVKSNPSRTLTLREVAKDTGRELIIGIGNRHGPVEGIEVQIFGAHFVEVEVDPSTGQVRVLRAACAYDAGRWINPLLVESQIQGGFIQGMGMALYEEKIMDRRNGMLINDSMHQYMVPTIADAPDSIVCLPVELLDASNSINAKGIGEPPLVATGAAIANAIHNALGVRMRDYPITPRRVLGALAEKRAAGGGR